MGSGGGSSSGKGAGGKWSANKTTGYRWQGAHLTFGDPASGPKYDTAAILVEIKTIVPSAGRNNFCMLQYLSTKKICNNPKHQSGKSHKYASAVMRMRSKFEHQPFRVDDKAKPKE